MVMSIFVKEISTPSGTPGRRFWYEIWVNNDYVVGKLETEIFPRKGIDVLWIHKIQILPEFRKKGFGSEVIRYCESLTKQIGLSVIVCIIKPFDGTLSKERLKKFYENNGFHFKKERSSTLAIKELVLKD